MCENKIGMFSVFIVNIVFNITPQQTTSAASIQVAGIFKIPLKNIDPASTNNAPTTNAVKKCMVRLILKRHKLITKLTRNYSLYLRR